MTAIADIAVIPTMIVGATATIAIDGTIAITAGIATVDMTRTDVVNWPTIDEVAGMAANRGGERSNAGVATSLMKAAEVKEGVTVASLTTNPAHWEAI